MPMNYDGSEIDTDQKKEHTKFPQWLKRPLAHSGKHSIVNSSIHSLGLHTVCAEAKCPNRSECYSKGTATFLILGNVCTRFCKFCGVNHGTPDQVDVNEPSRIVDAINRLKLRHVVITSVTRDDLEDGGASIYAETITKIQSTLPDVTIEILIPDFKGKKEALELVIDTRPDIFNHNMETVERLYAQIRPQAQYKRSLEVLSFAAQKGLRVKSGIMIGLGEAENEVNDVMRDMLNAGCSIITIGQYLRPSKAQTPVVSFVSPEQFKAYEDRAYSLGFTSVFSGPYIRSSYMAEEIFKDVQH